MTVSEKGLIFFRAVVKKGLVGERTIAPVLEKERDSGQPSSGSD